MPTQVVPLEGIAKIGVIKDSPAVTLPPGAWTDARNVRFDDGAIRRIKGEVPIFATFDNSDMLNAVFADIQHIAYWENPNVRCYVVINRDSGRDHAYLVGLGADGEAITSNKGDWSISNNWTSTQFNGGYSIIINNGIDTPQHITVQLGSHSNVTDAPAFGDLPGWDSYASGSYVADFLSVSADVLVAYGNLLIAGALTERSLPQIPSVVDIDVTSATTATITFSENVTFATDDVITVVGDPNYVFNYTLTGDGSLINQDIAGTITVTSPYNQAYTVVTAIGTSVSVIGTFIDSAESSLDRPAVEFDTMNDTYGAVPNVSMLVPDFSASGDITTYFTALADGSEPPREIVRDLNGVVRTSSVAAPGQIPTNWNPFDTAAGTADEINLADTGKIVAIRELRGNPFVYTSDTITQLRVSAQGLTQVPITKEFGALTQGGVFEFKGAHLVVGSDDIYIFAGNPGDIKSIADGRVRNYFYDNLDPLTFRDMQVVRNQINDEVWICYPTIDGTGLDEALIWNYTDNVWTMRNLPNVTALTVGPVQGASTTGDFYMIEDSSTYDGYEVTITNPNMQTIDRTGDAPITPSDLRIAIRDFINGQVGFSARVARLNDGTMGVLVSDARIGPTPWTLEIQVDRGTGILVEVPVTFDAEDIVTERPWSVNVLNEAKNFIVFTTRNNMYAAELGYDLTAGGAEASVTRNNLHFSPNKETEALTSVYINVEDGTGSFGIDIAIKDTAGSSTDFPADPEYMFDMVDDYKVDVRKTSRLIDWKIASDHVGAWTIADISLEVGQRGTR